MPEICSGAPVAPRPQELGPPVNMAEVPVATLGEIVGQYGTPTYAYDLQRIRTQVDRLRGSLPRQVELFYSLKANPSLGLCGFLADCGLGADVASAASGSGHGHGPGCRSRERRPSPRGSPGSRRRS